MHWPRTGGAARRNVELGEQLAHGQRAEQLVDDEAHRSSLAAVRANIDDRSREALVHHLRHRQ
jgi:hypothetical protein